jgi:hypothetical protein
MSRALDAMYLQNYAIRGDIRAIRYSLDFAITVLSETPIITPK